MINESGAITDENALVPGAILFLLSLGTITRIEIAGVTKTDDHLIMEYRFYGTSQLFRRSLSSLGIQGHTTHEGILPKLYLTREGAAASLHDHLVEIGEL